jgi:NADH dehydrogenase
MGRRSGRVACSESAGAKSGRGGRVSVGRDLRAPGFPEIFAIGNTVEIKGQHGPLPGIARRQRSRKAPTSPGLSAQTAGKQMPAPFRYRVLESQDDEAQGSGP